MKNENDEMLKDVKMLNFYVESFELKGLNEDLKMIRFYSRRIWERSIELIIKLEGGKNV